MEVEEEYGYVKKELNKLDQKIDRIEALNAGHEDRAQLPDLIKQKTNLLKQKTLLMHLLKQVQGPQPAQDNQAVLQLTQALMQERRERQQGMLQLQQHTLKLQLELASASRQTRTNQMIGVEVRRAAKHRPSGPIPGLTDLEEGDTCVQDAVRAVQQAFPDKQATGYKFKRTQVTPGEGGAEGAAAMEVDADDGDQVDEVPVDVPGPLRGWSLADLAGPPSKQKGFKEEQHMQPLIMGLLKAVAKTVGSDVHLLDTHSSPQLYCPNAKPDCTALANASDVPVWHEVVTTYEFKLGTSVKEQAEAAGQLHHRSAAALNVQPGRRHILGVSISMNTIEVMAFSTSSADGKEDGTCGKLDIYTTGVLPFSVDVTSPGFQLLVRVLKTPKAMQGFTSPLLPSVPPLKALGDSGPPDVQVKCQQLLRRGSAWLQGSWVYLVSMGGGAGGVSDVPGRQDERLALKLNESPDEGQLLEKLRGVPHVVRLVAQGSCTFNGTDWHALLLGPLVTHLTASDKLLLAAQVVYDVAAAIQALSALGILHRDVTPGNFGHHGGRGYLIDFSAGTQIDRPHTANESSPLASITGTLRWAPLSVLYGKHHTVSSQLEGLFISLAGISCGGHMEGESTYGRDVSHLRCFRLAQFAGRRMLDAPRVAEQLAPLVVALHGLFWPLMPVPDSVIRTYREDVKAHEVQKVCVDVVREHCKDRALLLV